jgi:hypothetical protein
MGYNDCMPKKVKNEDYYKTFKDFDTFVKTVKIPQKKWKFFLHFVDEKSDTLGNAVKSYYAAGYSENSTSRYRARDLYNSAMMQTLLTLYRSKTAEKRINRDISVFDRAHNDLLWSLDMAKDKADYMAVRAITMDIAKLHGILVEKHQVLDPATENAIDKAKQIEAAALAETRLLDAPADVPDDTIIEAEFEPDDGNSIENEYKIEVEAALLGQN